MRCLFLLGLLVSCIWYIVPSCPMGFPNAFIQFLFNLVYVFSCVELKLQHVFPLSLKLFSLSHPTSLHPSPTASQATVARPHITFFLLQTPNCHAVSKSQDNSIGLHFTFFFTSECHGIYCAGGTSATINPLNTKRRLLYLKTQFVPCSKHFSSRL